MRRKDVPDGLFGLPKSSFGSHKVTTNKNAYGCAHSLVCCVQGRAIEPSESACTMGGVRVAMSFVKSGSDF